MVDTELLEKAYQLIRRGQERLPSSGIGETEWIAHEEVLIALKKHLQQKIFETDIETCPRCGLNHTNLTFVPLTGEQGWGYFRDDSDVCRYWLLECFHPSEGVGEYDWYWAECPVSKHPVLLKDFIPEDKEASDDG